MKGKKIEWKKDNYPLRFFICLISINIPVEKTKILTTKLSSSVKTRQKGNFYIRELRSLMKIECTIRVATQSIGANWSFRTIEFRPLFRSRLFLVTQKICLIRFKLFVCLHFFHCYSKLCIIFYIIRTKINLVHLLVFR